MIAIMAVCIFSCRTKDGAPGPAGESAYNKQGTISGTLRYLTIKGDSAIIPFNFDSYYSVNASTFKYDNIEGNPFYRADVSRFQAKERDNAVYFSAFGNLDASGKPQVPEFPRFEFNYAGVIKGQLFEFYANPFYGDSQSSMTITNFNLDTLSGRMVYDYMIDIAPSDISNQYRHDEVSHATIKGRVDVVLNRNYYSGGE